MIFVQAKLHWDGGLLEEIEARRQMIENIALSIEQIKADNILIDKEIVQIKSQKQALEDRARKYLGLIREGETVIIFKPEDEKTSSRK